MEITHVTDQNFAQEVLQSNVPVLVDFWAEWCGPCHVIAPVLDELAKEYDGKVKFVKLNVDENQQSAQSFGVMSIPNLIIFKNGERAEQIIGVQPKASIEEKLKAVI